ncbi:uncharacterized protein LOC135372152 [Ornithodoros turicata]|uniref:uncharacterized protein LOC135372152 n=1 Tax=Ornithodoros turicata TaxID=34597 RepID=UPI003139F216
MDSASKKNHDRPLKRGRTDRVRLDVVGLNPEPWFPKVLVIKSDNESKPLAKVSPFLVAKELEKLLGKSYNAKKLSTGDLQVEVHTKQQSTALQAVKQVGDIKVTVTTHRTLNIVKGVISEDELLSCSEAEIEEGLKDQGVVCAKRIVMRRDGKEVQTKHVILSFQLHTLPSEIKAGYINCHIRPFIPNPRRCFKCQRFGHSSQMCRGQQVCPKCAGNDHPPESCSKEFHCVNCQGGHPTYSRSCPRWKDEKDILRIRTEQKLTYKAAKAQLDFQKKGMFSEVVRRGVAPLRVSVETQTPGPPLHTPQPEQRETQVSSLIASVGLKASPHDAATTSSEAGGSLSVWDGVTKDSSQTSTLNMEIDDDDRASQKSSSSLPSTFSQAKEKRERTTGRGRGAKANEQQKQQLRRVQAP